MSKKIDIGDGKPVTPVNRTLIAGGINQTPEEQIKAKMDEIAANIRQNLNGFVGKPNSNAVRKNLKKVLKKQLQKLEG